MSWESLEIKVSNYILVAFVSWYKSNWLYKMSIWFTMYRLISISGPSIVSYCDRFRYVSKYGIVVMRIQIISYRNQTADSHP